MNDTEEVLPEGEVLPGTEAEVPAQAEVPSLNPADVPEAEDVVLPEAEDEVAYPEPARNASEMSEADAEAAGAGPDHEPSEVPEVDDEDIIVSDFVRCIVSHPDRVEVNINGKRFPIKRGQEVALPQSVIEVLNSSGINVTVVDGKEPAND